MLELYSSVVYICQATAGVQRHAGFYRAMQNCAGCMQTQKARLAMQLAC